MEVHAHTHTSRKKWTHYHLGVSHVISCRVLRIPGREPAGAYGRTSPGKRIYGFSVDDLKNDSAFLSLSIHKLIPYHLGWLDSTLHLFRSADLKGKDRLIYQAFMLGTAWGYNFHPTERTLSQLHTEGFHLIRNKNATNIIGQLESQYKFFNSQTREFSESMQNDLDLSAWLFADREVTSQIGNTAFENFSDSASVELRLSDVPAYATINFQNKEGIKSYVDKLERYGFYLEYAIKLGQIALLREINIAIGTLKKEYHLK
jgi:hypothetical protein